MMQYTHFPTEGKNLWLRTQDEKPPEDKERTLA